MEVARSLLPGRDKGSTDLFALEVSGDSMIDAMVNDGDIVIMRPTKEVRNGEMVAVWLNDRDETTLKYFYREVERVRIQPANSTKQPTYVEKVRVRLQPANPTMQPIFVHPSNLEVQGKVIAVIRQL